MTLRARLVIITLLALFWMAVPTTGYAQRVVSYPSGYNNTGLTAGDILTSTNSAQAVNITTNPGMLYGLTADAELNTSGTDVFLNVFNAVLGNVTPGTTVPLFTLILRAGVPNSLPLGEGGGLPFSTALSANCTTIRRGTVGTAIPCHVVAVYHR